MRVAAADRRVARDRSTEVLLHIAHGEAALRAIDLRVTHLHLVVDYHGVGERAAGDCATAQQ
jgi:hypothetical protein